MPEEPSTAVGEDGLGLGTATEIHKHRVRQEQRADLGSGQKGGRRQHRI